MLNVTLPLAVESAVQAAARRAGQSVDEYLTHLCAEALALEVDRARLDAYLAGTPGVPHGTARPWLEQLAAGVRTPCPR